jgi:hypothetical protein
MCGTALSRATRKTLKINILQYFHFANELYWRTTQYLLHIFLENSEVFAALNKTKINI